jgi:heme/copper-type cytochrome/quinol oxidase subunit 1
LVLVRGLQVVESELYQRAITAHGAVMVLACLVPGAPAALDYLSHGRDDEEEIRQNTVLRASLVFYWCGLAVLVWAMLAGKLDHGLDLWSSYCARTRLAVLGFGSGMLLTGLSTALFSFRSVHRILSSLNGPQSACSLRLVDWFLCLGGIVHLLVLPLWGCALLLVLLEQLTGVVVFDPAGGGDPKLLAHLFWAYLRPAVVASVLPVIGWVSDLVGLGQDPDSWRYRAALYLGMGCSMLGCLTWGSHLIAAGQSHLVATLFSFMSLMLLLLCGGILVLWLGALGRAGPPRPSVATGWTLRLLALAWLVGLPFALLRTNEQLSGTLFATAGVHALGMGVMGAIALLGTESRLSQPRPRAGSGRTAQVAGLAIAVSVEVLLWSELVAGAAGATGCALTDSSRWASLVRVSAWAAVCGGLIVTGWGVYGARVVLARRLRGPKPGY